MRLFRFFLGLALAVSALAADGSVWVPPAQLSWQWQLQVPVDLNVDADLYDIDLFTNDAAVVKALHAAGRKAICYMSAGSWEPYRPDAGSFPEAVKGKAIEGFPDEKWLDIRRIDVLAPIMEARLDLCKSKGFDAVEPDNVDGYTNKTGFPLKAADQLAYNRYLARAAHDRGLSVGLKNDVDQIAQLVSDFDWALNEQCFEYKECAAYAPFLSAGKAVFEVEYNLKPAQFCTQANALNFNSLQKNIALDSARTACRTVLPVITAVTNAASYSGSGISPGEIVTVFGTNIGPPGVVSASSIAWPATLAGVRVLFDGAAGQILYVSGNQLSVVAPSLTGKTTVGLQVDRGSGSVSATVPLAVTPANPGLFTANSVGTGLAAAVNQDGSINGPGHSAPRGSYVSLFATGVSGNVRVRIGGQEAVVSYAGGVSWSGPGLTQINVIVPESSTAGPAIPVTLISQGVSSPDVVVLSIAP